MARRAGTADRLGQDQVVRAELQELRIRRAVFVCGRVAVTQEHSTRDRLTFVLGKDDVAEAEIKEALVPANEALRLGWHALAMPGAQVEPVELVQRRAIGAHASRHALTRCL